MKLARGLHDGSSKNFSDALMAEADTKDGNFSSEVPNSRTTDASFLRITRAWRDAEKIRLKKIDLFERVLVIFYDLRRGT